MNDLQKNEISITILLDSIQKLMLAIESSAIKETTGEFLDEIRRCSRNISSFPFHWEVSSISDARDYYHGILCEDIAGGFRVYNWHDHGDGSNYIMFDDTKNRNILDKILSFFGRKTIKPLNFGSHYGRFHVAGHYVGREEFVDYVKDNYPDIFQWVLFNPEMI